jgi:hypothetical protein
MATKKGKTTNFFPPVICCCWILDTGLIKKDPG